MSRALPLWEEDESDVKPEHRLHFGHVLLETEQTDRVLNMLCSVLKLPRLDALWAEINTEVLPREPRSGVWLLNDDEHGYFIIATVGPNTAVFGPHMFFFSSSRWIKLSRKLKTLLAFASQLDLDSFSYTLFLNGRHICNACRNRSGVRESVMEPIEFYLNGRVIYKAKEEEGKLTEELRQFISQDIIIDVDESGELQFVTPFSKQVCHKPTTVRHAVFDMKNRKRSSTFFARTGI